MNSTSSSGLSSTIPDRTTIFRNKRFWLITLLIVLIGALGISAYLVFGRTNLEVATTPQVQTAVARIGDLTIFASGAGEVIPASEISVGFQESGVLSEILVAVGDKVETGQVLARLQTNNDEGSIAAGIASARLSVLNAQKDLDNISDSWQLNAAQALLAVEEAEQALEDLQNPELQEAQAQLALIDAQSNFDEASDTRKAMNYQRCSAETIEDYQGEYDKALARYQRMPDDKTLDAVETALVNLNWCQAYWSAEEIAEAEANLKLAEAELREAELAYERVQGGSSPAEIAVAEAQLAAARREWERIKDGPDPEGIAIAEATLAVAQAQLAEAEQEQVFVDLLAPIDGTVLSIDASVGENIGSSAFITLADLEQPFLEVYLDETDLDKVSPGFEVEVVFDALPDQTFTGHVVEVDPSLATVSNITMVRALVLLDSDSFAKPQTLAVGLNASVDVIGGRAEEAVLVPVEALRELGPDEYAVFVVENGEPRLRTVTVGLVDFTTAEILTGLEAGEIVSTGVVETNQGE